MIITKNEWHIKFKSLNTYKFNLKYSTIIIANETKIHFVKCTKMSFQKIKIKMYTNENILSQNSGSV